MAQEKDQSTPIRTRPCLHIQPPSQENLNDVEDDEQRPHTAPTPTFRHESDLPDFDFSQRRPRPRSHEIGRAVSNTIPGFHRLSNIFSSSASRPRSPVPNPLTPSISSAKLRKSNIKSDDPDKSSKEKGKGTEIKVRFANAKAGDRHDGMEDDNEAETNTEAESQDPAPLVVRGRDTLPMTPKGLEVRLNYHLSELDRLRRHVSSMNTIIEETAARAYINNEKAEAKAGYLQISLAKLDSNFDHVKEARDGLMKYVNYHIGEVDRIQFIGLGLRQAAEPDKEVKVIKDLGGSQEEWTRMFKIGNLGERDVGSA